MVKPANSGFSGERGTQRHIKAKCDSHEREDIEVDFACVGQKLIEYLCLFLILCIDQSTGLHSMQYIQPGIYNTLAFKSTQCIIPYRH